MNSDKKMILTHIECVHIKTLQSNLTQTHKYAGTMRLDKMKTWMNSDKKMMAGASFGTPEQLP